MVQAGKKINQPEFCEAGPNHGLPRPLLLQVQCMFYWQPGTIIRGLGDGEYEGKGKLRKVCSSGLLHVFFENASLFNKRGALGEILRADQRIHPEMRLHRSPVDNSRPPSSTTYGGNHARYHWIWARTPRPSSGGLEHCLSIGSTRCSVLLGNLWNTASNKRNFPCCAGPGSWFTHPIPRGGFSYRNYQWPKTTKVCHPVVEQMNYFVVHFHLFNCNRLSFPTLHLLDLPTLSATSSDWWWRILKTLKLQKKNKSKNELKLPKQIMKTSHIHDIEISVAAQHLSDSHLSSMNSKVGRNVSVSGWMMVYPVYPVILEILMFFGKHIEYLYKWYVYHNELLQCLDRTNSPSKALKEWYFGISQYKPFLEPWPDPVKLW